ncbi:hypothetical protein ASPNIDRAFT_45464 [Aspergillus niger ATCC 1015]|uniref:Secreted protein n=1 Tax=Aspergillus niger (strain ATCC 1015 / CBS 113.46 / FGSC A1144 / LSHB Ac4 / NCTC 3858a / NRRL 328 / USDA 3528.7) TaxID=380704 RepID=G3Y6Y7_ASPNA|nr:hypothetical protein ASPNIDRAFT_45464 [Aspergillus niger ATCC 1015]
MLFGLVLFLSHSFFSPFFPFSAGGSLSKPIPEGARTHTDYPTASNSRSTMAADWWGQRYGGLISQSQDQRQRRNKVLNQSFFFSLVSFGMRKRFGMPKLLRDLLIPRIVTQPSPRFSQIFIRCPGLVLRLSKVAPQNRRNSKAEGEFATVKFRSLPVVDGNRAGTPHEIQTLGHATIPPTSWALTNGYFYRRCRAEANPGIGLPALVRKLEKLRGKRWDRGERERETGDV